MGATGGAAGDAAPARPPHLCINLARDADPALHLLLQPVDVRQRPRPRRRAVHARGLLLLRLRADLALGGGGGGQAARTAAGVHGPGAWRGEEQCAGAGAAAGGHREGARRQKHSSAQGCRVQGGRGRLLWCSVVVGRPNARLGSPAACPLPAARCRCGHRWAARRACLRTRSWGRMLLPAVHAEAGRGHRRPCDAGQRPRRLPPAGLRPLHGRRKCGGAPAAAGLSADSWLKLSWSS